MEILEFCDSDGWQTWLAAHHDERAEAWLRIAKRGTKAGLIDIRDALEIALCYGWIDSVRRRLDDVSYLQRYSPRRSNSPWSKRNVARAEALIAAGRMRPAGLAQITAAMAECPSADPSQPTATVQSGVASALGSAHQLRVRSRT